VIASGISLNGSGMAALGAAAAISRCSVEVRRRKGVTFRWKAGLLAEQRLEVSTDEIEAFEVTDQERTQTDDHGSVSHTITHQLVLVRRDGKAIAFEQHRTRAQGELRRKAVENVLHV
jgi:hypothetical protein